MSKSNPITILQESTGKQLLQNTEQVPAFTLHRPTKNTTTNKKSLINAEVIEGYHITIDEYLLVYHYPTQKETIGKEFLIVDTRNLVTILIDLIIPVKLPLFEETTGKHGSNRIITNRFILTDCLGIDWLESILASYGVKRVNVLTDEKFENVFQAPKHTVHVSEQAITQNTATEYIVGYIPTITEVASLYQNNKINAETAEEIINISAEELSKIDTK